jgi:seryl-tRNA synthetase
MKPTIQIKSVVIIPPYLVGDVQSKLGYIDEAILRGKIAPAGDVIELTLNSSPDDNLKVRIEEKVQRMVASMVEGSFKPKIQVLEDCMTRPVPYAEDPNPELMARGEMSQEDVGIYSLGPLMSRLIDYFESKFLLLADSFGARPYRFPTLLPAKLLGRINYFRAFPHSLSFVTHLREDLDIIDNFARTASCDDHGLNAPLDSFAPIPALLSPAVCYHLYFSLADKPLPDGKLAATAVGHCYRYESTNLISLERLWNFSLREVIFVGSKDFVVDNREAARERMKSVFEEFGMAYRVESATDPFFVGEFRKQTAFQSAFQLKFEIRARLPFKESTLAVGSYNYHQDFFGRNLNISLPDGSPAHTACVGFGLERMAYAFLAQFGFDKKDWPEVVRNALGG